MQQSNWKWPNVIALMSVLIVNGLANFLPFNGKTTGEISNLFPVLMTPAAYTFSIWFLIYALLIAFVIYQARPKNESLPSVRAIGPLFVLSSLFNIAWILMWHFLYNQVWVSLVGMLGLLVSLIFIYMNVRRGSTPSKGERWFVWLPFSIYLAWICVATLVNIAVVLYDLQWDSFLTAEIAWTVAMLACGAFIAWTVGGPNRDAAFLLVFVWAYVGIAVKHHFVTGVFYTALGLAALLVLLSLSLTLRRRPK
ncbi:tryptophan-rich sensory protein [Paenibacillus sp. 481]|uniref:tryptophan-rich sensory protein n=1 Tax=Paenibacillus sp. 481 TaxID=2835869 RepID=UPI001E2CF403|nr:tryptophan-rich sensory protein [Paenibacillus sp. 481]UHA75030.1 tryptophan-rich sensory protein [Paenibacillus sp. 481]